MLMRAIKFTATLTIAAAMALPITAIVIDDYTVTKILKKIPGGPEQTNAIIIHKRLLASKIVTYFDETIFSLELKLVELSEDTLFKLESTYQELFKTFLPNKSSNKVVIYLPNERKKNTKSSFFKKPVKENLERLRKESNLVDTPNPIISKSPNFEKANRTSLLTKRKQSYPKSKITSPRGITKKKKQAKKLNVRILSAKEDHKRGLSYYKVKNFKKAAKWFLQAAKKGYASSQYNLGVMSYLGQGVPQNFTQAANWFEKAGNQDHASAQYNLGYIYYEGKGVEKDNLQAYMWIDRSANLGDKKAIRARDSMQIVLPKEIFN